MNRKRGSIFLLLVIGIAVVFCTIIFALAAFVVVYLFVAQPNQVKGMAMYPTYHNDEYIMTSKIAYRSSKPQRGDVVIYKSTINPDLDFIHRIVGLPGEKVKISRGKVYINGNLLDESSYLKTAVETGPEAFLDEDEEVEIPQEHYFLLGDNRPHSSDSRERGPIPKENIIGRVAFCYWNCEGER